MRAATTAATLGDRFPFYPTAIGESFDAEQELDNLLDAHESALRSYLESSERAERLSFEVCEALRVPHVLDFDYVEASALDGVSDHPVIYFDFEHKRGRGSLLIALEEATTRDLLEALAFHVLAARSIEPTDSEYFKALSACIRASIHIISDFLTRHK